MEHDFKFPNINIFTIAYNQEIVENSEPGYLILDHTDNERSDWREYWPIRKYIQNHKLVENDFYGFFSPKFSSKTKLSSQSVFDALSEIKLDDFDVISFSPFIDQIAWYKNQFEQTLHTSRDILPALEFSKELLFSGLNTAAYYSSSMDTIFCNYFIATGRFWNEWHTCCEKIFCIAEDTSDAHSHLFSASTAYGKTREARKTFIIERIASMLIKAKNFRSIGIKNMPHTFAIAEFSSLIKDLIHLDSLKIAYNTTGNLLFRDAFEDDRVETLEKLRLLRVYLIK